MAPVQKISSYSVAASSSLDLTSKVELNSDYRTESSEHWHAPLFIAPSGTAFSDDFFENARARFHHELTNFLAEWDDAEEDMDDNWFGKETLLSRRLSPQTQLSSHSKIRDNKFAACVNENGDYEVMMNICQLKLKDIKVRVTGERDVVVEGHKEEGSRLRDCHKSPRRFLYQFSLPDKATSDAISAVLSRDGILIITIPSKAQNARNTKISLMENDIVNRTNIIGESTEQCGRKSKVTEIQKRQSAAETSGSNMTESSHQGSLEAVPGPVPVVRYEKEKFQTLEKAEDGSLLGRKNDLCIENSMASLKISSSSTSSFFESKDSSSKISLANEKRVRETIIPIRMEESVDKCGTTIFHHSSLNKKESCQDNDSLHHHESSNGNVALSQSEVSVTNSTELQDEVLRCTNDNEESFAQLKHSTFAQRSEGLQLPSRVTSCPVTPNPTKWLQLTSAWPGPLDQETQSSVNKKSCQKRKIQR
ncbi:uncharacterized protein [Macrobrachium rosenbergii]|uniref:uncharacterized protein n=1 Tax=Macrobrachium rosenbergii TaxID=79674 RepID=UPI0034D39B5B